ncbi:hypothetical protein A9Q98_02835 [Thalassotalea sp. 42_200_T64]|nr:hypothetical protein A9Q98_02835 [Thalassotalea sp. 42_200_T64]
MPTWLIVVVIVLAIAMVIGNLSMLKRSAYPLRRKSLNDLSETLPRAGDRREEEIKQEKINRQKDR